MPTPPFNLLDWYNTAPSGQITAHLQQIAEGGIEIPANSWDKLKLPFEVAIWRLAAIAPHLTEIVPPEQRERIWAGQALTKTIAALKTDPSTEEAVIAALEKRLAKSPYPEFGNQTPALMDLLQREHKLHDKLWRNEAHKKAARKVTEVLQEYSLLESTLSLEDKKRVMRGKIEFPTRSESAQRPAAPGTETAQKYL